MATQCDPQESKGHTSTGGGIIAGLVGMLFKSMAFVAASVTAVLNTITRDGTVAAIGREAIKDVRDTTHEVFFGKGERSGEPGAPLNPTQGEIAADRRGSIYGNANLNGLRSPEAIAADRGGVHGEQHGPQASRSPEEIAASRGGSQDTVHGPQPMRSPEQIAADRGGVHGQERGDDGTVLTQRKPDDMGWKEWEKEREKARQEGHTEEGYGRERGRSLPEEERQKEKEREREGRDR